MTAKKQIHKSLLLSMVVSATLVGCGGTTSKPLYQWESYNNQVYEYLKGQGNGPEAQASVLEEDLQKINAAGNTPAIPAIPSRPVFRGYEGIGFRKLLGAIA